MGGPGGMYICGCIVGGAPVYLRCMGGGGGDSPRWYGLCTGFIRESLCLVLLASARRRREGTGRQIPVNSSRQDPTHVRIINLVSRPSMPRFYLTVMEKNRGVFLHSCEIKSGRGRPG